MTLLPKYGNISLKVGCVVLPKMKKAQSRLVQIDLDKIAPSRHQTRRDFDKDSLMELAASIRAHGLLQPVTVRDRGKGYFELVAGERRLRAASLAGLVSIPAIIIQRTEEESSVLTLIENLHRQNLNCFEEAEGILAVIKERGITQEVAAELIGKTQSTVANKLRLLRFPEDLREPMLTAGLTERHARELLRLPEDMWHDALAKVIECRLNVKDTERLVTQMLAPQKNKRKRKVIIKDIRLFFNSVEKAASIVRESGIPVDMKVEEKEDIYTCTVHIPKKSALPKG